jgi:hypothetical protein
MELTVGLNGMSGSLIIGTLNLEPRSDMKAVYSTKNRFRFCKEFLYSPHKVSSMIFGRAFIKAGILTECLSYTYMRSLTQTMHTRIIFTSPLKKN